MTSPIKGKISKTLCSSAAKKDRQSRFAPLFFSRKSSSGHRGQFLFSTDSFRENPKSHRIWPTLYIYIFSIIFILNAWIYLFLILRYIKLWNTETGQVVSRFTSRKIPYCVKFNPDKNRQHLFVAGTSDKKIICWDIRSGDIVQEYDRHLGAVNTITFVDENRRFVTTSDDKSLRVWEWDIPVDMKYIADPTMHSMPAVTPAPNGKFCQQSSLQ